jgi:hypothetical protein
MFQVAIEYLDESRGWEYIGTITDQTQGICCIERGGVPG